MDSAVFKRTSLAMMMALALAACGGGGGGGGNDDGGGDDDGGDTSYAVTISSSNANKTADDAKTCHQGVTSDDTRACGLRMYQVMVEAYVNGDDTVNYNTGYGPSNHKGDLQGVIDSLDYIKSTGVNAIWLTPIFNSCGDTVSDKKLAATGYYTCDYFTVDPYFGNSAKLKELVDTAHAKGLYVFLDGVFGHAITNKIPAAPVSGVSPVMVAASTGYTVDYTKANSLTFFTEVATHYINTYGIDGWRLDQSYQVPVEAWNTIRTAVESAAAARASAGEEWGTLGYMVGEDWAGQNDIVSDTYGTASLPGLKSAFDFPLHYGLVQAVGAESSGATGDATSIYASWNNGVLDSGVYPSFAMPNLFLGNHDIPRFGDLLQRSKLGDIDEDAYWLRHKAAFSFMAATSGPITFYYGEEIGDQLDGFAAQNTSCGTGTAWCDDNVARTTGKVAGVTSGFTPSSRQSDLKTYLKSLLDLREAHPALYNGSLTRIFTDSQVLVSRKDNAANADHVLYLLNTKTTDAVVTLSTDALGDDGQLVNLLDSSATVSASGGNYVITVPALTGVFYQIN